MGIASFSFWRAIFSSLSIAMIVAGCGNLQTRESAQQQTAHPQPAARATPTPPAQPSAPPVAPPAPPAVTNAPTPPPAPTFLSKELPKVGVILGPGGMKAFAHLGVLRELQRARIPVHALVGLEWGAVMGGLYSVQGQVNEAEWKAFKLKNDELPGQGFLSSRIKPVPVGNVQGFLNDAFGGNMIEKARVSFACPTYSARNERFVLQERGSFKDAMSRCVPYPPMFVDNGGFYAAPFSVDEAAAWLRARGANVILLVNVLGQGEILASGLAGEQPVENLLWSEIRRQMLRARQPAVNWVVNVNTSGHPITDSEGRRALMDAGSKAATDVVNKMAAQYGF